MKEGAVDDMKRKRWRKSREKICNFGKSEYRVYCDKKEFYPYTLLECIYRKGVEACLATVV